MSVLKQLFLYAVAALIVLASAPVVYAQEPTIPPAADAPDQTLVMLEDGDSLKKFTAANSLAPNEIEKSDSLPDAYIVDQPKKELEPAGGAELVERRQYRSQYTFTNQDPLYPQYFSNKINAPAAWDVSTGSSETTVAVIDTGFALDHQDLASRWADGGWDFVNNDNVPQAGANNPNGSGVSHGTMVAGLVGATGNNGIGIAGVNWQTKILPLQALNDNGSGWTDDITAAVNYAITQDVDVINMSLGSPFYDPVLQDAVTAAVNAGITVVAAAGNCGGAGFEEQGCWYEGQVLFPARGSDVIAVGAVDSEDARASFSSYDPELDIVAPGSGAMRSTAWTPANQTSAYTTSLFGTSFSSPIVAGAAALQLAVEPGQSPAEIKRKLTLNADRVPKMKSRDFMRSFGYGRLNLGSTIQSYGWPGTAESFSIIRCDGTDYFLPEGATTKWQLGADAREAWGLQGVVGESSDSCALPASLTLGSVIRSSNSGYTYVVHRERTYRLTAASARAWGLGTIYNAQSSDVPMATSQVIRELHEPQVMPVLARSAESYNLYLVDNGKRYYFADSPDDEDAFSLWYDKDALAQSTFESEYLQTLPEAGELTYGFRRGSNWYLVDSGVIRKIKDADKPRWQALLGSSPSLSSDALTLLPQAEAIGRGFQQGGRYYKVYKGEIDSTTNLATAKKWGIDTAPAVSPVLRKLLTQ